MTVRWTVRSASGPSRSETLLDGPQIELTRFGKIAEAQLLKMQEFYQHISVDDFVIMPNHIHVLLRIKDVPVCESGPSGTPVPTAQHPVCENGPSTSNMVKIYGNHDRTIISSVIKRIMIRIDNTLPKIHSNGNKTTYTFHKKDGRAMLDRLFSFFIFPDGAVAEGAEVVHRGDGTRFATENGGTADLPHIPRGMFTRL